MRTFLAILGVMVPVMADVPIDRAVAASMKTYDLADIGAKGHGLIGQIVKIKFVRRAEIEGATTLIYSFSTGNRPERPLGVARATVPEDGMKWFSKAPTDFKARGPLVAIARIDKAGQVPEVTLLGREIKTDAKGSVIVW